MYLNINNKQYNFVNFLIILQRSTIYRCTP